MRKMVFAFCGTVFLLLVAWTIIQTAVSISRSQDLSNAPPDAVLVLGGSIAREAAALQMAKQMEDTPILISSGSAPPCLIKIAQKLSAPTDPIWLERCATSTFTNILYSIRIFRAWNAKRILIVSSTQQKTMRAYWIARILYGTYHMKVQITQVPERGVPGSRKGWVTAALDWSRTALWAAFMYTWLPECGITTLRSTDLSSWERNGYVCEYSQEFGHLGSGAPGPSP